MQFSIKSSAIEALRAECVLVPVGPGRQLTAGGKSLDEVMGGALSAALARGDLQSKAGATLLVYGDARKVARAVLVATGDDAEASERNFTEAVRAGLRQAGAMSCDEAASLLHEAAVKGRDTAWKLRQQVATGRDLAYRFERLKSRKESQPVRPARVQMLVARAGLATAQAAVARATALANGSDLARDLGNLPGNICTPGYLADAARELGTSFKLKVQVLERKQMEALKMGSLLSVARGSEEPPKLIVLQYAGGPAKQAPVALIGKGITFDTGGISIKPAAEMDEMKFDMCGAASVLGTLRAIAEMKLPINVVGIIAAAENMPGGSATKPGDIVTSMSGQTIEILNTDAEGRLVLADALTYAERFKPQAVIDIATLPGACVIALGNHRSGLFSSHDGLADSLLAAGREAGDPCWRMPLDEEYGEGLKSNFADVANVGGRAGGSITAACFLARFARQFDWAHLDIAGTAWRSGAAKGSSARPVPLLTQFLIDRAAPG
ncbi:MAG: leucyl aminopeptidase [Burkholderiales bacterium]|nr:leucyl aminopeptidase [Burkholderiales bacterium]